MFDSFNKIEASSAITVSSSCANKYLLKAIDEISYDEFLLFYRELAVNDRFNVMVKAFDYALINYSKSQIYTLLVDAYFINKDIALFENSYAKKYNDFKLISEKIKRKD
ncbi:MAG: hypothetical protein RPT11_06930 [Bermanella sp.]